MSDFIFMNCITWCTSAPAANLLPPDMTPFCHFSSILSCDAVVCTPFFWSRPTEGRLCPASGNFGGDPSIVFKQECLGASLLTGSWVFPWAPSVWHSIPRYYKNSGSLLLCQKHLKNALLMQREHYDGYTISPQGDDQQGDQGHAGVTAF